ncbi:MAG: polysaccharide biosynthesis/export family protein, partial [Candidatus Omnitrophota bacterium]
MMKSIFKYIIILLLILSTQSLAFAEEKDYRVGPENLLQIDVHYGKDGIISQKVRVSSKNLITFPLIGEVDVKGLTVSELEKKLYTLLEKDYLVNPQVSVVIEEYST